MRCDVHADPARLRTAITATPGEYDGYPFVREVRISGRPLRISPDRAAVSSVLCFADYIGGSFALDRGCSPQVSSAIRRWFSPAEMHVLSVDFEPAAGIDGDAVLHVVAGEVNGGAGASIEPTGSDVLCTIIPEGTGFVAAPRSLSLASNASLLAAPDGTLLERMLPAVGVAVLFADDFFANAISVPGVDPAAEQTCWQKLRGLLDATGLRLVAGDAGR